MSLHTAIEKGNLELVKELIDSGADINAETHDGKTPLYIATQYSNVSIVTHLLGQPSLNTDTFYHGKTPLYVACKNGYQEIVKALLDDDRFVRHVNIDYKSSKPIHVAIKHGYKEIVNSLLEKDNDVNAIDSDGCSPLWLALINDQEEIAETLLKDNRVDVNLQYQNSTPLQFAIQERNSKISNMLIERGADITVAEKDGLTPLHQAVNKGLIDVVNCLINVGANIHVETNRGNTPFHIAAMDGELEIAKILIANGAHVDRRSGGYCNLTPLQLAVKNENLNLAKYLIEKGADINAMDPDAHYATKKGGTLLHWAARHYGIQDKLMRFLVEHGADVNATAYDGRTPLCLLVKHHGSFDSMRFLIENGASLNNDRGGSPLYWAFYMDHGGNHPEVANFLIEMGTDVNGKIDYFRGEFDRMRTALHLAKNLSTVKLLVERGANVNAVDKCGNTPLHSVHKLSIAKYLVKNGANINITNNEGYTPLHMVENFHIAKFLIEQGANVNATTDKGYTPLHLALTVSIAELLIEKGADFKTVTTDGKTVLHTAAESDIFGDIRYQEVPDLINFYSRKGIDVNVTDSHGNTPLHCCAKSGNIKVASRLLENGAVINVVNNDNKTPITIDVRGNNNVGLLGHMLQSIGNLFTAINTNVSLCEIKRMIVRSEVINCTQDDSKMSLLHYAVQGNRKNVVGLLLQGKKSLGDIKSISRNRLRTGKGVSKSRNLLSRVLEKINVNACSKDNWTALHYAAQGNNLDIVRLLLKSGAAYNVETNEGKSPIELTQSNDIKKLLILVKKLFDSVKKGNYEEVVQCIKKDKAILNAVEKDGCSPLHWATKINNQSIVTYLLDNGANSVGITNDGKTVLHFAVTSEIVFDHLMEHVRCIGRLDELINAKTADGNTALHMASENGCLEIVKTLMNYGAIYNLKNDKGKDPFDLSTNQKVNELLKLVNDLFHDADEGNPDVLVKLCGMKLDLRTAAMNVRDQGRTTIIEIIKMNEYESISKELSKLLEENPASENISSLNNVSLKSENLQEEFDDMDIGFGLFD